MSLPFSHSYRRSAITLVSAAAAASLVLASCAPDDDDDDSTEPNEAETVTVTAEPTEDATDDTTDDATGAESTDEAEATETAEATEASGDHAVFTALEAVQAEYPDATIIDFEYEGGSVDVHIIEGDTEWELTVDPDTEDITSTDEESADSDDLQKVEDASVDIIDALRTAVDETGADPDEGSLDTESGTVVWEFEMSDGTDIYIDAATGDVVS